jgi:WD repeat-containing protein 19
LHLLSFCLLQEEGNYKLAHAKLFTTVSQLVSLGATPPQDLLRPLELLHSYILVKSLVGMNNHDGAARMLARVAGSISRWALGGCVVGGGVLGGG